jgi:hypothetical protein
MLKKRFGIPENSQYVVIACTEPDTSVTLYQPDSVKTLVTRSMDEAVRWIRSEPTRAQT